MAKSSLKNKISYINQKLGKINKAFGKDTSKALYNEKLKTVPGVALTKGGNISVAKSDLSKLDEDSIKYLKDLVKSPEAVLKELKESKDEYIQEAISRSGDSNDQILMKNLGKEIVAKKSLGGTSSFNEALNLLYQVEIAIENNKGNVLPEPEKTDGKHSVNYNRAYTELHNIYIDLLEEIYMLDIKARNIDRDLSEKGRKTYSDLAQISSQIDDVANEYYEYEAKREQYLNNLSQFMEME